jgi:hypothetical protein
MRLERRGGSSGSGHVWSRREPPTTWGRVRLRTLGRQVQRFQEAGSEKPEPRTSGQQAPGPRASVPQAMGPRAPRMTEPRTTRSQARGLCTAGRSGPQSPRSLAQGAVVYGWDPGSAVGAHRGGGALGKTAGAAQLGQGKVTERPSFLGREWAVGRQILGEGPGKRQEHL